MTEQPTICAKCKHHRRIVTNQEVPDVWYHWFCHHPDVARPVQRDWVTGKLGYAAKNDFGREVFVDEEFPHCRDINPSGICERFEAVTLVSRIARGAFSR